MQGPKTGFNLQPFCSEDSVLCSQPAGLTLAHSLKREKLKQQIWSEQDLNCLQELQHKLKNKDAIFVVASATPDSWTHDEELFFVVMKDGSRLKDHESQRAADGQPLRSCTSGRYSAGFGLEAQRVRIYDGMLTCRALTCPISIWCIMLLHLISSGCTGECGRKTAERAQQKTDPELWNSEKPFRIRQYDCCNMYNNKNYSYVTLFFL